MFEPSKNARVFAVAPGIDFAEALVDGLICRSESYSPEEFARIELFLNTSRMQRRVREVFATKGATFLPRIRLITDLAHDPVSFDLAPAVQPLRRRLEISVFIAKLLEREPELAPRSAIFDLSESLANLMDEMQGEGVIPEQIANLDVSDQSGHWERSLKFLQIITPFFDGREVAPDKEARQRMVIECITQSWNESPPDRPIIVAGSTGSRGATSLFMQAVAQLPQGAVILPGYDFEMPDSVWKTMEEALTSEDHPQFRFHQLMQMLNTAPNEVISWTDAAPSETGRNRLISLSLRPAPITNQWLEEGPKLGNLIALTKTMTLVEAGSPRAEAETIALRLRQAAQEGKTAALISPDRMLTRQVTAALDRWDIKPDDSAGIPLGLSPPGRFLNHTAELLAGALSTEQLLALLKHPLCHSDREDRGDHLKLTRELELHLRKTGTPLPNTDILKTWAGSIQEKDWVNWITNIMFPDNAASLDTLAKCIAAHIDMTEKLCAGPDKDGSGGLWKEAAGREALRVCEELRVAADAAGEFGPPDYISLLGSLLSDGTVREGDIADSRILIWGTLEARVQGVDLTILGGMNEGTWPQSATPDPWLNRAMRAEAGLLLPERKIGLSAHDYQQAIAGKEVMITRAKRTADAETVPSRWVNRLMNLLNGLPDQDGPTALAEMRTRGDRWMTYAAALTTPTRRDAPALRPAPSPPLMARPDQLSVTQIKTLIRDPFAIYARKTLRLQPLEPLTVMASASLRGIIVHRILERFISDGQNANDRDRFMQIAREEFQRKCPWLTIRTLWLHKLAGSLDQFLADETDRQINVTRHFVEVNGKITLPLSQTTITCNADRIDLMENGDVSIYDYKTGVLPTGPQQEKFDKQLLVEAAMMENGAFDSIGKRKVQSAAFIGINASMRTVPAPLEKNPTAEVWSKLDELLMNWKVPHRGYTARLALFSKSDSSPYDHLSRFGEWDTSQEPMIAMLK